MSPSDIVIGHRIARYGIVTSTNDLAWDHAADSGAVFLADEQTHGRGRRGDAWRAQPGSSLLLSFPLTPPASLRRAITLTLWASLGVCRTIEQLFHLPVTWKWPNDVLIAGRKVCGTIVEQRGPTFVIGVGLNLTTSPPFFDAHHLSHAAALSHYTTLPIAREAVLTKLLATWNETSQKLTQADFTHLLADWRLYSGLLNHPVALEAAGQHYTGILTSLTLDAITLSTGVHLTPESITRLSRREAEGSLH